MKKSRYMEEEIIGILKQHEAGVKTADLWGARDQRGDVLWLEVEVRRPGGQRGAAAESDGGREPSSEAAGCGAELARRGAEGDDPKKRLELAGLRDEVAFVSVELRLSERTACKVLGVERSSYRYEPLPDRNIAPSNYARRW